MIKELAGFGLIVWGYLDGIKYCIEANKIKRLRSSKNHSRRFIDLALGNDLYRLMYFCFIDRNIYLLITTLIALVCMLYMFWEIYLWYPYRMRGCSNFRRPNLFLYTLNSLLPNRLRRRL